MLVNMAKGFADILKVMNPKKAQYLCYLSGSKFIMYDHKRKDPFFLSVGGVREMAALRGLSLVAVFEEQSNTACLCMQEERMTLPWRLQILNE